MYKEQIDMGETMLDEDDVEDKVREMGERYQGVVYHLLQMNCNHFSSDFCYELLGKRPPMWINRLADVMVSVHCLFPPNWLPPLKPPMVDPTDTEGARMSFFPLAAASNSKVAECLGPFWTALNMCLFVSILRLVYSSSSTLCIETARCIWTA